MDDGYLGSGKRLKRAINKYGIDNFNKEIIAVYDVEWKMNLAEKILVVTDPEISYNLCPGGKGGWGYVNSKGYNNKNQHRHTLNDKKRLSDAQKRRWIEKTDDEKTERKQKTKVTKIKNGTFGKRSSTFSMKNRKHSTVSKFKMSESKKGENNKNLNTTFVSSLDKKMCIRISRLELNDYLSRGWIHMRIMNFDRYFKKLESNRKKILQKLENNNENKKLYQRLFDEYKNKTVSIRILSEKYHINKNIIIKNFKKFFDKEYKMISSCKPYRQTTLRMETMSPFSLSTDY